MKKWGECNKICGKPNIFGVYGIRPTQVKRPLQPLNSTGEKPEFVHDIP